MEGQIQITFPVDFNSVKSVFRHKLYHKAGKLVPRPAVFDAFHKSLAGKRYQDSCPALLCLLDEIRNHFPTPVSRITELIHQIFNDFILRFTKIKRFPVWSSHQIDVVETGKINPVHPRNLPDLSPYHISGVHQVFRHYHDGKPQANNQTDYFIHKYFPLQINFLPAGRDSSAYRN